MNIQIALFGLTCLLFGLQTDRESDTGFHSKGTKRLIGFYNKSMQIKTRSKIEN